MKQKFTLAFGLLAAALLSGCANTQIEPYNYTAFKEADPKSILVLPPTHTTPNVQATNSVFAQVTRPLAESGFYVLPVSLVAESLKENGVTQAAEAHDIPLNKLQEVFGADAVLYLNVTEYGTVYRVVASDTSVAVEARLVNGQTGDLMWAGSARASTAEQQNQQQGGLVGMLITAVVAQVISSIRDDSHPMAGLATQRLLTAAQPRGMLHGPRSPNYIPN
jgi:hypothetical protein